MSLDGQSVGADRYTLVPRTLTFLFQTDRVLLLRRTGGPWAGLYNGIGGHVEQGEDPLSAAGRELQEEAGVQGVSQALAGIVTVDTGGAPGIGLFVFAGEVDGDSAPASVPGTLDWVLVAEISSVPHVQDLPYLLEATLESRRLARVFFAAYRYSPAGELIITPAGR
jgi:8-oxo-dGTP diphosphatase